MKMLIPSVLCAAVAWCAMNAYATWRNESRLTAEIAQVKAHGLRTAEQAAYAARLAEFGDRVLDLPEDAHAWHTSVFTNAKPLPRERRLLSWFDTDPQLRRLKEQTHFHHYTPASSIYRRFANLTAGGLPVVVLQDATGEVVYKVSGPETPATPWPLVRGIIDCVREHCPHCPRPQPKPEPSPQPDDSTDEKPLIPDIVGPNANTPIGRDDTLAVTAAAFALSLAGGFLAAARRGKS